MPRVLLVSFFFPPTNVVGAMRASKLARYLPAHGWEPTVLTVDRFVSRPDTLAIDPPVPNIVRAPFIDPVGSLLSRGRRSAAPPSAPPRPGPGRGLGLGLGRGQLMDLARSLPGVTTMHVPDRAIPWYGPAVGVGLRTLRADQYDAIISTSPPPTAHLVAATLSSLTGIPWVADYRDLWSGNYATSLGPVRRRLERGLERRVLAQASGLVSISGPVAERLGRLHGRRVHVVTNGFDPAETAASEPLGDGPLTLSYTGAIYSEFQDPGPLLAGIALLRERRGLLPSELRVNFYGSDQDHLPPLVHQYGVNDFVQCHGFVPRAEAVARQRASDALVVLDWNAPEERGVLPLKALEYLHARRPILIIGERPDGLLVRLFDEARVGTLCTTAQDVASTLEAWLEQGRTRPGGALDYSGDPDVIDRFNWQHLAGEFAALLNAVAR